MHPFTTRAPPPRPTRRGGRAADVCRPPRALHFSHHPQRSGGSTVSGLHIVSVPHLQAGTAASDALVRSLSADGVPATLIVRDAQTVATARARLARGGAPMLGVGVSTLEGWALGRWKLFGDGRAPLTSPQRRAAVARALAQAHASVLVLGTPAMPRCVEDIVRRGAGVEAFEGVHRDDPRLSAAESDLIDVCRTYRLLIEGQGLVEPGLALALLPDRLAQAGWSHLVLDGVDDLGPVQVALLAAAARHEGVTVVARLDGNPAFEAARAAVGRLERACAAAGVEVARRPLRDAAPCDAPEADPRFPWASRELVDLAERLFAPRPFEAVAPTGALRVCLPAGRYAEPELLARELRRLVEGGVAPCDIAVASPDPLGLAKSLVGRLAQGPGRAIACQAEGSVAVLSTETGRMMQGMLALLREQGGDQPAPQLRAVASDLARNRLSGIPTPAALALDRSWRQNRATTADMLLADLARAADDAAGAAARDGGDGAGEGPRAAASPFAAALGALAAGDAALCARTLAPSPGRDSFEDRLERACAAQIASFAHAYAQCNPGPLDAASFVSLMGGVSVGARWVGRPVGDAADGDGGAIRFCTIEGLRGASYRAVVLCGLTADACSVADRPTAQDSLWEKLGIPGGPTTLQVRRRHMRDALEAARETLVLERPLHDPEAKELRPAALLEEIVDCYRADPTDMDGLDKATGLPESGALPCSTLGEERFCDLASPRRRAFETCDVPPPGILPSRESSRALLADAERPWSPSALELYLSCPLRWLYERRLPGDGIDARFGPLETGSFSHRVLQTFHELLARQGIARIEADTAPDLWEPLFERVFDDALAHQEGEDNPLVPLSRLEHAKVAALRGNLRDCIARDALLPDGYVPRLHEWGFGAGAATPGYASVPYGGVLLRGVVDRIDMDANGNALVIDYKGSLQPGHGVPRAKRGEDPRSVDPLPLHAQALMYAAAVQRCGIARVTGALYISYGKPEARGFVDPSALRGQRSFCAYAGDESLVCPTPAGENGLQALLDYVEGEVADAMDRLRDGDVSARPRFGKKSCDRCSVASCPARKG